MDERKLEEYLEKKEKARKNRLRKDQRYKNALWLSGCVSLGVLLYLAYAYPRLLLLLLFLN